MNKNIAEAAKTFSNYFYDNTFKTWYNFKIILAFFVLFLVILNFQVFNSIFLILSVVITVNLLILLWMLLILILFFPSVNYFFTRNLALIEKRRGLSCSIFDLVDVLNQSLFDLPCNFPNKYKKIEEKKNTENTMYLRNKIVVLF